MKTNKKAKLVYIMSQGHSGSTLLDFLIGSIPGTFSTGELVYFPWQLDRTNKEKATVENESICTCGKDFYNCSVWGKVINKIEQQNNINFQENPYKFSISLNRSGVYRKYTLKNRIFTYGFYFFSKYGMSEIITFLYKFVFNRDIKNNWFLFDSLCEISGAKYIVDSTKNPIRFRLLHSYRPENVKLIILIRDIYGVAASGKNYGRKLDVEKSANSWIDFYNNKVYNAIKNNKKIKYIIVKYEDIAREPEKIRNKIIEFLNEEKSAFENYFDTSNYHIIAGNPMRYKKSFSIKYDQRWKNILTEEQIKFLKKVKEQLSPIFK